jgi:hypothetical protein
MKKRAALLAPAVCLITSPAAINLTVSTNGWLNTWAYVDDIQFGW